MTKDIWTRGEQQISNRKPKEIIILLKMDLLRLSLLILTVVLIGQRVNSELRGPSFTENYKVSWGYDHVRFLSSGRDVQISLDQASGSSFESKVTYGSGFFHMNMKVPGGYSAGVVTAFYLCSQWGNNRDEVDFEFLGNTNSSLYLLQTNIITDGKGDREQRIKLWFDPTTSYHSYRILWNHNHIVFFVDKYPIRVFKNKQNIGVGYPIKPMNVLASIWNGDGWASNGGKTKIDWRYAPFVAGFRNFGIYGCEARYSNSMVCYSPEFWWNRGQYWQLTPGQEEQYQFVRNRYMTYDYCADKKRFHGVLPPECTRN